jgi:DNA-directed RNA polymerase
MADFLWDTLSDERRRTLEAMQMSMEEALFSARQDRYKAECARDPAMARPEQSLIGRTADYLEPLYSEWFDKGLQMSQRPAWLAGLACLGPGLMAEIVMRTVVTMCLQGRPSFDRTPDEEHLVLPTVQEVSLAIGDWAIKVATYRQTRSENLETWRSQNQFYKKWTPKRCLAFVKSISEFPNIPWRQKADFGHHMLRIADAAGIVQFVQQHNMRNGRRHTTLVLALNPKIMEELSRDHERLLESLVPTYRPMICPPTPHTVTESGGAASPWVRRQSVKALWSHGANDPARQVDTRIALSDLDVMVLNALQRTEWAINVPVLDLMEEMWKANHAQAGLPFHSQPEFRYDEPYPRNGTRQEKTAWLRIRGGLKSEWVRGEQKRRSLEIRLREARRLSAHQAFWHAWFCDFRGRKYTATEMLSPQGGDWDRALCKMAVPMRQTPEGLYWTKVHVANLWDKDKGTSFDERVRWVDENLAWLRKVAEDPMSHRPLWVSDKRKKNPSFQRYAAVRDLFLGIDRGLTEVPPQLDGSCNGAQHWAAMMRDRELATIVNLLPTARPNDLYQHIADRCTAICQASPNPWRELFMEQWKGRIGREIAKRPTMCDPYGITFFGIKTYCRCEGNLDWVPKAKLNTAAKELATVIDLALKGVLERPNAGKEWLKTVTKIAADNKVQLRWTSPSGFVVHHNYWNRRSQESWSTVLNKRRRVRFSVFDKTKISKRSALNSVAPNLTHSIDAAHMSFTILRCIGYGITCFWMVHDSYGVPAPLIPLLRSAIVEEFVRVHERDPLMSFKHELEGLLGFPLPDLPERGDLRIQEILKAVYIFA